MTAPSAQTHEGRARSALSRVVDPEIPVLTIEDIGILRSVIADTDSVEVTITPTYSGCPAMDHIKAEVERELTTAGFGQISIRTVYSPAWTTDWMTDTARAKLAAHGIAPPGAVTGPPDPVHCPRCDTGDTRLVSQFGSTSCKALMVCNACGEPFDLFKAI